LIHLIDATAEEPLTAYNTIQTELQAYDHGLAERPQILVLNKIDAVDSEELETLMQDLSAVAKQPVLAISAVARTGLDPLLNQVWLYLEQFEVAEEPILVG
jgi:GTP-binding protein